MFCEGCLGWCGFGARHGLGISERRNAFDASCITEHYCGVGFGEYTRISWKCTFMLFTRLMSILNGKVLHCMYIKYSLQTVRCEES